jgi:hypothetical protein
MRKEQISNQDYNLIKVSTNKITQEMENIYNFTETSIGFQFLVLSKIFKKQEDEIIEDITDTIFLNKLKNTDS